MAPRSPLHTCYAQRCLLTPMSTRSDRMVACLTCRHAEAAEHLADFITRNARVLDVGSGSGYLLAVLWEMAKSGAPDGRQGGPRIVGIDHVRGASRAESPSVPRVQADCLTHSLQL